MLRAVAAARLLRLQLASQGEVPILKDPNLLSLLPILFSIVLTDWLARPVSRCGLTDGGGRLLEGVQDWS